MNQYLIKMSNMKKNIPLYILLVFLIIVNGFFLINYLGKSDHKRPKGEQENFIVRELKFDAGQKEKFEELDIAHHKRMKHISESERKLKGGLFGSVSNETITASQIDSIVSQIGDLAKEKELEIFQHFSAVRNLCDNKQKDKFEQILRRALHGKRHDGPGAPPPDRRRDGNGPPPRHE